MLRSVERQRLIYAPPWRIELTVRDGVPRILSDALVTRTLAAALEAAGAPRPATLGLILTDDAEITALNETHMGHAGPTDVLSFPLRSPETFPDHPGKAERLAREHAAASLSAAGPQAGLPPGRRPH